ncbi:MAG: aminoglycoside phosphotransferase family protein [Muribaculaceae bacterium]|nr:aminoglycoside phosphotransferase family protein [Muribaculaceae bacterium]
MENNLINIVNKFSIEETPLFVESHGNGNINETYKVLTNVQDRSYILQRKNALIFKNIPRMMQNIKSVTEHILDKSENDAVFPIDNLKIYDCRDGKPFVMDNGEFWVLTNYIPYSITFEKAENHALAQKAGKGIGKFHSLLSDFQGELYQTIKGFHDLGYRFKQWDECIKKDKAERLVSVKEEVEKLNKRRNVIARFNKMIESGFLPKRVTHNDTKIGNVLFNNSNEVICVIDFDTVMTSTWINDFGDAIRTFTCTASENEKDLEKVLFDPEMFKAYTEGYLSEVKDALSQTEKENLYFAGIFITFEQALRFLMDYIDGDTYYKIDYPEHNLVRARNQIKLLEELERNECLMREVIENKLNNI